MKRGKLVLSEAEVSENKETTPNTIPLVLTKLQPLILKRSALPREHLIPLLQKAAEHRLTLVCAGVGYGKTTFLAHALNKLATPFVWYALSRSDRDIITFLSYLIKGIDRQWPGFAATLPANLLPTPNRQLELNRFVADFINALTEITSTDFLIVLDDFYLIEANPEVCQLVDYLLQYAPPHVHFILSSRTIPALSYLPRLRANGDTLEIAAKELEFTPVEVVVLFRQNFNLELPPPVIEILAQRTEGWALGLLLIGQSLKGQGPDITSTVMADLEKFYANPEAQLGFLSENGIEGTGIAAQSQLLFEYLSEEILRHHPDHIIDFLTSSAILSWLEPSLCNATLGRSDSNSILGYLEKHNLFVIHTEDGWLRYHRLFRDFLYHHLAQDQARFETLHRRAATYFEKESNLERAIHHWLKAGDNSRAAKLMEQISRELLQAGRFDTLAFWIAQIPPSLLENFPKLLLCQGQIYERQGRWSQALGRYEAAAQIYIARDDLVGLSDALSSKGYVLDWWRGEHAHAERLHQEALSYIEQDHTLKRAALLRNLSRNQLSAGNSEAALNLYQEALQIYKFEGDNQGELATLINPGSWLYHSTGDFSRALMVLRRAEFLACDLDNQRYLAEIYNNVSVNLHFLWRSAEAQEYAEKALTLSREIGDGHNEAYAMMNLANALEATCAASIQTLYEQYQKVLRIEQAEGDYRFAIATLVFMSIMLRHGGNMDEAVRRGKQALPLTTEHDLRWLTGFVLVNLGAAQIEIEPQEARVSLEGALDIATHCQDIYHQMASYFWLATLYHHQNDPCYVDYLHECLLLAVGHNLDYFFQSESRTALVLLAAALEHNLWPSYVSQVLIKIGKRVTETLQPLLSHSDNTVRQQAQHILSHFADPKLQIDHSPKLQITQGPDVSPLTIRCFGHFRVQQGDTWLPEKVWRRRKSRRLLQYIILSPNHTISRDQLVDRLWSDLNPNAANSNFYRTLYNTRRVLEPQAPRSHSSYLVLKRGMLRLDKGRVQSIDVDDFTAEIEIARQALRQDNFVAAQHSLEAAVGLYTDDLLTGDLYDDWVQPQREYLRNLYVDALTNLANLSIQTNHYEQAVPYLRKIFNLDPAHEEICLKLMDCLIRAGHRTEALRYAVACEEALAELGVRPSTQLFVSKEKIVTQPRP